MDSLVIKYRKASWLYDLLVSDFMSATLYGGRRFRAFRQEALDAYVFESLEQVREISAEWMRKHNEDRPMTP
jgi:hypothetical protein